MADNDEQFFFTGLKEGLTIKFSNSEIVITWPNKFKLVPYDATAYELGKLLYDWVLSHNNKVANNG